MELEGEDRWKEINHLHFIKLIHNILELYLFKARARGIVKKKSYTEVHHYSSSFQTRRFFIGC